MKSKEEAVVLLSGGIDSTVVLYLVKNQGLLPRALIFDYKQKHSREVSFGVKHAQKLNVPYEIINIELPWGGSALTDQKIKVPDKMDNRSIPVTYVPGRNLVFLSFAVSFAEAVGVRKIFIGAHTQDYSGYPDCRPGFLNSFQHTANLGTKNKNIEIVAPFLSFNKSGIIKKGLSLKVDFKYTWSCYKGGRKPCGVCDSCRYRKKGFQEAGLQDPLGKEDRS